VVLKNRFEEFTEAVATIKSPENVGVHGPEILDLAPGRRDIRWNGSGTSGLLPGGSYLLSLSGSDIRLSRRVVLAPDRPYR
jgi:hypothetical protein